MTYSNITYFNIEDSDKYANDTRGNTMNTSNFMTESTRDMILKQIDDLENQKPAISDQIGSARLQGGLE